MIAAALLALCTPAAHAADVEQHLTWAITLDGTSIGKRDLTLKWAFEEEGRTRRFLEVWTELDATVLGLDYRVRQRITGQASRGPAAFAAVTQFQADTTEVQGRLEGTEWMLSVATNGREWHKDLPKASIDLSTLDLLDPESRVGFESRQVARILASETGDILEGEVKPIGQGKIDVAGAEVPVAGFAWTPDEGEMRLWFSAEGYLVRYETNVMGRWIVGTLTAPPPKGLDDAPIPEPGATVVTEVPL